MKRHLQWLPVSGVKRLLSSLVVLQIGSMVAPSAWAQSNEVCPGSYGEQLPSADQLKALEPVLTEAESRCNNNGAYLAFYGAWLLHTGAFDKALTTLERALMLEPTLSGAQIDYAQALAATGDTLSAKALYKQLIGNEELPSILRPSLESNLASLELLSPTSWHYAAALSLRHGYDTNINGAPIEDRLTLTLPDGDAILALGEAYRPRSAAASIADIKLLASKEWVDLGRLRFQVNLGQREAKQASYSQLEGNIAWQQRGIAGQPMALSWQGSTMRYEGQNLLRAQRMQWSHEIPVLKHRGCLLRAGADVEQRAYPASPSLNGLYTGITGYTGCEIKGGILGLQLRSGVDKPKRIERPGGSQRRVEVRLQGVYPVGDGRFEAEVGLMQQSDATGYSPILEGGATRWQRRNFARLEWTAPVNKAVDWFFSVDASTQRSNIQLFSNKGTGFWVGLRYHPKFGPQ